MLVTYDHEADAVYICLNEEKSNEPGIVAQTQGDWPFHIDLDAEGYVFDIEVLDASKVLNQDYINKHKA